MTQTLFRLVPAAALVALLAGCSGYSPPPMAQISCTQQDRYSAGADYLNCVQGWINQNQAQGLAQKQAPGQKQAQANGTTAVQAR